MRLPKTAVILWGFLSLAGPQVLFSADADPATSRVKAFAEEWQRYKPLYQNFGMSEVWTTLDSGKCDDGDRKLQDPHVYANMDSALGANARAQTIELSLKLCRERFAPEPATPDMPITSSATTTTHESTAQLLAAGQNLGSLGSLRVALSQFYLNSKGQYPSTLMQVLPLVGLETIPTLALPDHPKTSDVMVYSGDVCTPATKKIDMTKIKDSGKWGYVADPKSACWGMVFIDCTHERAKGKLWFDY